MSNIFLVTNVEMGYYALGIIFSFFITSFLYIWVEKKNKIANLNSKIKHDNVSEDDYYTALLDIEDPLLAKEIRKILDSKKTKALTRDKEIFEKNIEISQSDLRLKENFSVIESEIYNCDKCSNHIFRIWVLTNSLIQIRCDDCKKKFNYYNENFENLKLLELVENFNLFNQRMENEKLNYLIRKHVISLDTQGYRTNFPKTYPYILHSKLEPILVRDKKNASDNKQSRHISQDIKDVVWRRDEGKCVECGSNKKLEFDHIIPYSKGGSNTYRNIQLLCEPCNRHKSDKIG